ncbi:hypothetical protein [Inquilinus ginsengisoli]|uniref:hypothetical protein n=1 Tax=Inquilinus ginsengisoli TaxID=363840 RepID=UPI003D1A12BF
MRCGGDQLPSGACSGQPVLVVHAVILGRRLGRGIRVGHQDEFGLDVHVAAKPEDDLLDRVIGQGEGGVDVRLLEQPPPHLGGGQQPLPRVEIGVGGDRAGDDPRHLAPAPRLLLGPGAGFGSGHVRSLAVAAGEMGLERQGVADAAADAVERELQVPDRGGVAGLDRGEGGDMHGLGALHRHLGQPVEHARSLPGIGGGRCGWLRGGIGMRLVHRT